MSSLQKLLQAFAGLNHGTSAGELCRQAALALSAQDAKVAELEKRQAQAFAVLRQSYVTLAFAFRRLHESARSRDGELCQDFQKVRAQIERHFKEAGVRL